MLDPEIAGPLVVAAGNAATLVKTIVDTVGAARGQLKDKDADKKLSSVYDLAISLQTQILHLQEVAFRLQQERDQLHKQNVQLQDENAKLHQKLGEKEAGTADREKYERRRFGDSVVVVDKDDPEVKLCATCFENGKKSYLSPMPVAFRDMATHRCAACKGHVKI